MPGTPAPPLPNVAVSAMPSVEMNTPELIPLPGRGNEGGLRITISAGIAGLRPGWADARACADGLLAQADEALLRAKRDGRDRVMISGVGAAA